MRQPLCSLATFVILAAATAAGLARQAHAQQATASIVGTACQTPLGTPSMQTAGLPQLGGEIEFIYSGPNQVFSSSQQMTRPYFVLGFDLLGPVTIPTGLFPNQPAGCELLPSNDLVIPMMPEDGMSPTYEDRQSLSISSDPALLGFVFFTQWITVNIQCGFAGCNGLNFVASSETALCTIGI